MATQDRNDKAGDDVYVNVGGDSEFQGKLVAQSRAWNAPKLVVLTAVTLAVALVALYGSTIWTGTWGRTIDYPNFLAPESEDVPYAQPPAHD